MFAGLSDGAIQLYYEDRRHRRVAWLHAVSQWVRAVGPTSIGAIALFLVDLPIPNLITITGCVIAVLVSIGSVVARRPARPSGPEADRIPSEETPPEDPG